MLRRELEKWSARTGKTRADAAAEVGVSERNLRLWLSGRGRPRPRALRRLADVLEVDPVALMDGMKESATNASGVIMTRTDSSGQKWADIDDGLARALFGSRLGQNDRNQVLFMLEVAAEHGPEVPVLRFGGTIAGMFIPLFRDDVIKMDEACSTATLSVPDLVRWLRDRPAGGEP